MSPAHLLQGYDAQYELRLIGKMSRNKRIKCIVDDLPVIWRDSRISELARIGCGFVQRKNHKPFLEIAYALANQCCLCQVKFRRHLAGDLKADFTFCFKLTIRKVKSEFCIVIL